MPAETKTVADGYLCEICEEVVDGRNPGQERICKGCKQVVRVDNVDWEGLGA